MRINIALIILLFIVAGIFEFLPAISHARAYFSETAYLSGSCDCFCILKSRPWYGQINHWTWLWVLSTPIIIFSVKPTYPSWQRALRTILAVIIAFSAIFLSGYLALELRNDPFSVQDITSSSSAKERFIFKCFETGGDGGALVFFGLFNGLLYSFIYTGWCEIAWSAYHKYRTKLIDASFRRDWVNKIIVSLSLTVPSILLILLAVKFLL